MCYGKLAPGEESRFMWVKAVTYGIESMMDALLPAILDRTFKGEL